MTENEERRSAPRIQALNVMLFLRPGDLQAFPCRLVDLSATGILVEPEMPEFLKSVLVHPVKVGMDIRLTIPSLEIVRLKGRIVRLVGELSTGVQLGIQFEEGDEDLARRLECFNEGKPVGRKTLAMEEY